MEHIVDTVIIGGGPAGISCAMKLQKNNISNLVVERKSFPRDKTCGGLVTEKTFRALTDNFGISAEDFMLKLVCDKSNTINLNFGQEKLVDASYNKTFHLIKRRNFDNYLVGLYKKAGGKMLENVSFETIDPKAHKLVLTNGDTVKFRHLVAADGALSRTREALGMKKPTFYFCTETHIPRAWLNRDGAIGIYFGVVKNGYAWVFPSGETWCIGLCGTHKKGIRYDEILKKFLSELGVDPEKCVIKGAFLPDGKTVKQNKGSKDAVLVGDAGGFVDPISGEGLFFALSSGAEAANAIISGGDNVRQDFLKRTKPFKKMIGQGNFLNKIFYKNGVQKLFKKVIRGKSNFVGYFCDNLVATYDYTYFQMPKLHRDYEKSKK